MGPRHVLLLFSSGVETIDNYILQYFIVYVEYGKRVKRLSLGGFGRVGSNEVFFGVGGYDLDMNVVLTGEE